ncbi:MAG: VCBS repeat-containing protein [Planctomycetes bacterium]|nr:VCBS repeat-containing protein [Planctomycetota bacterium]
MRQGGRGNIGRRCALEWLERRCMLSLTPAWVELEAISPTQARLEWTDVDGEVGYYIYTYQDGASTYLDSVGPDVTQYTAAGLTAEQTHHFLIRAFDAVEGSDSPWASVTMPGVAPRWVDLQAIGPTQVQLEWTDVAGEDGYYIYTYRDGASTFLASVGPNVTQYTADGLAPGEEHHFLIQAFDSHDRISGTWESVTTPGVAPLSLPPSWVSLEATGPTQVDLEWTDVVGEDGYYLYTYLNGASIFLANFGPDVTQLTALNLAPDESHHFLIQSYNAESTLSSPWASVTTPALVPELLAPSWVSLEATGPTQVELQWTDVAGEDGYYLYTYLNGASIFLANFGPDVTQYTLRGLAPDQIHHFLIQSHRGGETFSGPWAEVATPALADNGLPTVPQDFRLTAISPTRVDVQWSDSQGEDGYYVYQVIAGAATLIGTLPADQTTHSIDNLAPSTAYFFSLAAFNSAGSATTLWQEVSTPPAVTSLGSVDGLVAGVVSASGVRLDWNDTSGEDGYRVFRDTGGTIELAAEVAAGVTQLVVSNLDTGTLHRFRVEAFAGSLTTTTSWIDVTTPPAAPQLTLLAASSSELVLSWPDVGGEDGYRVMRRVDGEDQLVATLGADETGHSLGGLQANTSYTLLVEAFNVGGATASQPQSAVTLPQVLQLISPDWLSAVPVSSSRIDLSWTDAGQETGYNILRDNVLDEGGDGVTILASVAADDTVVSLSGLAPGTNYTLRVEAFGGGQSVFSPWQTVTTPPIGPIEPGAFAPLTFEPGAGSHAADPNGSISVTFTQPIDAAALSGDALVVYGSLSGRRLIAPGSLIVDGQTVTFTPQIGFLPGETVQVSVTTALVSQQGESPTTGSVWQFRVATSGGSGVMQSGEQPLGNLSSFDVALGDVNGDGRLDAMFANFGHANELWLGVEGGGLVDSGQRLGDGASADVELGDLDGDGDLDAFVANVGVNMVWLNDGQGVFTQSPQNFANIVSRSVALGDLDGDGDLDALVVQDSSQNPAVWLNDGDGMFIPTAQALDNSRGTDVVLADFDRDGDLDALVTRSGAENLLWLNNGAGGFVLSSAQLADSNSFAVAVGDVNGDGHLDILLANGNDRPNEVWFGDGAGGLVNSGQQLGAASSFGIQLGDLDGDGDLDAFVANFRTANRVWFNDGAGVFSPAAENLAAADSRAVALGDLDGDGDLDALVANSNRQANILWFNAAVDEVFDEVGLGGSDL